MKIAIVGNAGSGKSSLARTLHAMFGIPVYHLDQYFWKPGWQEPDRAEFEKIHNALCDKPQWIIEGMAIRFFAYRIERADIAIFLNVPTYRCLYRVIKRTVAHFGKEYFASAQGCPERGPSLKFLIFIMTFNRKRRPIINALFEQYRSTKKIIVINNQTELATMLRKFALGDFS